MKLITIFLAASVWWGAVHGTPLLYGPWTGAPEAGAVTVSWVSAPASAARVEYGPLVGGWPPDRFPLAQTYTPRAPSDREIVHVRLEGLHPDTWYMYRVTFPDGSHSPLAAFRTAPPPGKTVVFGVLADTQWQWTGLNRVETVAAAMAEEPFPFHFVLHGGDLVETPIPSHWEFFFRSMAPILRWAPLLPVLGNHEGDSITYYQHFSLPPGGGRLGKRWWTLRWGDVVVVGLDTNARRPQDFHDQIGWLRASLSGPEPHKFVIFHHPVFSSDAIYGPGVEGLQILWHPVFVELGVDVVFTGHAHNYERIERDGVTYLVVGGGGGRLRPLARERVEGSRVAFDEYHFYLRVVAGPTGIHIEVRAVARQVGADALPEKKLLDALSLPTD